MDLICNGYEFDMYLLQFEWNRCLKKSGFREKQKIHRAAHFGTTMCNWYGFDL